MGSTGTRLPHGKSYQLRDAYGALALLPMYSLNTLISHQAAQPKKNQPGSIWPSQPPAHPTTMQLPRKRSSRWSHEMQENALWAQ